MAEHLEVVTDRWFKAAAVEPPFLQSLRLRLKACMPAARVRRKYGVDELQITLHITEGYPTYTKFHQSVAGSNMEKLTQHLKSPFELESWVERADEAAPTLPVPGLGNPETCLQIVVPLGTRGPEVLETSENHLAFGEETGPRC